MVQLQYKQCGRCGEKKALHAFHKNAARRDGLTLFCRECRALYSKTPSARALARARNVGRYQQATDYVRKIKSQPCMDCGGSFPYYVMDFDHRDPAKKTMSIADWMTSGVSARLLAELAQCDVVCSNCHRIRTHKQRESGALKVGRARLD